ncbi:MAG: DegV family protein, partial [Clostridia bacterium]
LYISFSSGMSGSFDNMTVLQQKLLKEFPTNKFVMVDSLSGGGGEGLLVYYAKKMQQEGKSIEEITAWLEENKYNCHHIFIVDDLENLKRSGRISKISALVGMIIGVKPVLTLSYHGKVQPLAKTMGRKKAITTMINEMKKAFVAEQNEFVLVGNCDCLDDAHALGERIKKEFGIEDIRYSTVTHLVGANVGPDALVVYFMGKKREKSILEMIKK